MKRAKVLVLFICVVLSLLPFFWFTPGELELGGDSNRLFLYDPGAYLQVNGLYSVEPTAFGKVVPNHDFLPFLGFLQLANTFFRSPYVLMCLLNSLKLVGSFLFIYLIVVELMKNHIGKDRIFLIDLAGMLAGLFYTFSPSVGENMHAALLTHNQVFLNPVIFYLLLRFLLSSQDIYLWVLLLVTVIFSPNFSLNAPPPPFAFFPLAFSFLLFYIKTCIKKSIPWKKLLFGLGLFLGIHAFHIIPELAYILDPGSYLHVRLLDAGAHQNEALNYFNAVLGLGKVSLKLFYTYAVHEVFPASFFGPLMVVLGLLLYKSKQKAFLLIAIFFFITLFLTSANITSVGVQLYRNLFYLPGFGMFRVFYGQWQWVYAFFYSLLFGASLVAIFSKLKLKYTYILFVGLVGLCVYNSWVFISGNIFKQTHWGSNNMTNTIRMNPDYEKSLAFIKSLPDDGRVFNFPFTDFGYQLVPGSNNGAYIGVSPTAYLTGKRDFSGYQNIAPFSDIFLNLIKQKKYADIKKLFSLLNVKYIFYIADPKAYKEFFPEFPYSLFIKAIPDSQTLASFVHTIAGEKIFQSGDYVVYSVDKATYVPHIYTPTSLVPYENEDKLKENAGFFVGDNLQNPPVAYVERNTCKRILLGANCDNGPIDRASVMPKISFRRLNPTKYIVDVSDATGPFALVFSDQFHKNWKAYIRPASPEAAPVLQRYFNGSVQEYTHASIFWNYKSLGTLMFSSLPEMQHGVVNGYANAWYITPTDSAGQQSYKIIIEMVQQRMFYYGLGVSIVSLGIFLLYGIKLLRNNGKIFI